MSHADFLRLFAHSRDCACAGLPHAAKRAEQNDRLREIADQLEALQAERDTVRQQYDDLLATVVQPWVREGDGAHLWKVFLAWWDAADSREKAVAMVNEAVRRRKEREAKTNTEATP